MTSKPTRVVVIGAGFAGVLAARRLAWKTRGTGASITLVNGTDEFVERVHMHRLAVRRPIGHPPIARLLGGTPVGFVRGWVTKVDLERRQVEAQTDAGPQEIGYDNLVYALGSTMDVNSVPGVRDHAYVRTPSGERSAQALQTRLPALNAGAGRLLICGGGATGIEAAAEFADAFPQLRVHLVTRGRFGGFVRREVADYAERSLGRRGVTIQDRTTIVELRPQVAVTNTGEAIPFDVCVWTGGFMTFPLARETGLAVSDRGQILVDPYMRSISHPEVYAAGDAALPVEEPGARFRMGVFTATVTGLHAADCLNDALRGQSPRPLSFAYVGQAISLGRRDAIFFFIYPDDTAKPPYFTGRAGYWMRELGVAFVRSVLRFERRPGFLYVPGKGRYAAGRRRSEARATAHARRPSGS